MVRYGKRHNKRKNHRQIKPTLPTDKLVSFFPATTTLTPTHTKTLHSLQQDLISHILSFPTSRKDKDFDIYLDKYSQKRQKLIDFYQNKLGFSYLHTRDELDKIKLELLREDRRIATHLSRA